MKITKIEKRKFSHLTDCDKFEQGSYYACPNGIVYQILQWHNASTVTVLNVAANTLCTFTVHESYKAQPITPVEITFEVQCDPE